MYFGNKEVLHVLPFPAQLHDGSFTKRSRCIVQVNVSLRRPTNGDAHTDASLRHHIVVRQGFGDVRLPTLDVVDMDLREQDGARLVHGHTQTEHDGGEDPGATREAHVENLEAGCDVVNL